MAEAAHERLAQELVGSDFFFASEHFCTLADAPLMIVDGREIGIAIEADRVEVAREWFLEVGASFAIGFFDSAVAHAVWCVGGENAVATVDDRGHKVAIFVDIADALLFDNLLGCRSDVVPYGGHERLEDFVFFFADRSACVSFDAAFAFARIKVAEEKLLYEVESYESVFNLYHWMKKGLIYSPE